LRQRRALRDVGLDPDEAQVRSPQVARIMSSRDLSSASGR
jgi:hypothetical protein